MSKILTLVNELKSTIEGMEAVVELDEECKRHLRSLYTAIWTEAVYDPFNKATQEYAQGLLPHIEALNEQMKFKV